MTIKETKTVYEHKKGVERHEPERSFSFPKQAAISNGSGTDHPQQQSEHHQGGDHLDMEINDCDMLR